MLFNCLQVLNTCRTTTADADDVRSLQNTKHVWRAGIRTQVARAVPLLLVVVIVVDVHVVDVVVDVFRFNGVFLHRFWDQLNENFFVATHKFVKCDILMSGNSRIYQLNLPEK